MRRHVRTYLKHFNLGEQDVWSCERCSKILRINNGLEIHHILFRSKGGTDDIENLACLCHECHTKIHDSGEKFTINDSILGR